ncbi:MAG: TolB family protein [Burkholderiales bacterium]
MRGLHLGLAAALAVAPAAAPADTPTDAEAEIVPAFVRPLFPQGEKGRNDSSPSWAPDGELLAVERAEEARREIVIAWPDGVVARTVYYQASEDDPGLAAALLGLGKAVSYNSGFTWSPAGVRFVFMSNAGEGNYDLYLGTLAGKAARRLTQDPQKDGQPHWSPNGGPVVFVSGRTGAAQLFLLDVDSRQTVSISNGEKAYLYPRWSPDGKRIAAMHGVNENHDIVVLDDLPLQVGAARPQVAQRFLTTWRHDDLSPSWSPDGRRIAFYSNYNAENDPRIWSLVVIEADGGAPTEGDGLAARVVAHNVIPDVSMGPAWLPDSRRIAYVRNDRDRYHPIYVVDVESKQSRRLATGTSINHDLASSPSGVLAFRAQVDQWDQIFLVKLADEERKP